MAKKKGKRDKPSDKRVRKKRMLMGILVFAVLFCAATILVDRFFVGMGIYPYTRRGSLGSTILVVLVCAGWSLWHFWGSRK